MDGDLHLLTLMHQQLEEAQALGNREPRLEVLEDASGLAIRVAGTRIRYRRAFESNLPRLLKRWEISLLGLREIKHMRLWKASWGDHRQEPAHLPGQAPRAHNRVPERGPPFPSRLQGGEVAHCQGSLWRASRTRRRARASCPHRVDLAALENWVHDLSRRGRDRRRCRQEVPHLASDGLLVLRARHTPENTFAR